LRPKFGWHALPPLGILHRMAIRDWPVDERPREKLLARGAEVLSDAELLAILLRTGIRGHSAVHLAREVLQSFHSLRKLIAADRLRFCAQPGLGIARFAELQAAVEIARRHLAETLRAGPSLASPRATRDFLVARLRDLEHEVFCCLYLTTATGSSTSRNSSGAPSTARTPARNRQARPALELCRHHRRPQPSIMLRCSVTTRVWRDRR